MQSFKKKIKSVLKNGIDPVLEGINNFKNENKAVEVLTKERLKECLKCPNFIDEPIDFLKVKDKRIPELTDKMCGDCFCTLSYKLRQSTIKCKLWQE
jgi:hypothetical protein